MELGHAVPTMMKETLDYLSKRKVGCVILAGLPWCRFLSYVYRKQSARDDATCLARLPSYLHLTCETWACLTYLQATNPSFTYEIIIVDDGSRDGTTEVRSRLCPRRLFRSMHPSSCRDGLNAAPCPGLQSHETCR